MPLPIDLIRQLTEEQIAFVRRSGLKAETLDHGHVVLRMPLAGNENHIGSLYAGALFTLAELPGGVLCLTAFDLQRFYPVVREVNLKFLRPALSDIRVEARLASEHLEAIQAQAEQAGKADFALELELTDAQGEVVARSSAVYQLRKR
ncbi:MAG: hypothetical protein GAK45_02237 [Pseudomonas citronellolis]|nr:MAG: hypothetical protein GAK45_02237 [Pseudomonas citronellolis]